jgi:hypothetical protein
MKRCQKRRNIKENRICKNSSSKCKNQEHTWKPNLFLFVMEEILHYITYVASANTKNILGNLHTNWKRIASEVDCMRGAISYQPYITKQKKIVSDPLLRM